MSEIDLIGMANAILRWRDRENELVQECRRLQLENEGLRNRLGDAPAIAADLRHQCDVLRTKVHPPQPHDPAHAAGG